MPFLDPRLALLTATLPPGPANCVVAQAQATVNTCVKEIGPQGGAGHGGTINRGFCQSPELAENKQVAPTFGKQLFSLSPVLPREIRTIS